MQLTSPMESPITIKIDSFASAAWIYTTILTPVTIIISGVLITVRICHWQNVNVEFVGDVFVLGLEKFVDHECGGGRCDPFSGVNTLSTILLRTILQ
jgi:hypothetical protein